MREGDRGIDEDEGVVGVDRRYTMFPGHCSGSTRREGVRAPLLLLAWPSLRCEEGFSSGPWAPWLSEGRSPSKIGSLSLSLSLPLFCVPVFWPLTVSYIPGDP